MFVLILMHFPCSFQIWPQYFTIRRHFWKFSENSWSELLLSSRCIIVLCWYISSEIFPGYAFGRRIKWLKVLYVLMGTDLPGNDSPLSTMCQERPVSLCTQYTMIDDLSHEVQTQYLHFRFHGKDFHLLWKILEEISRRSILFNN